MIEGLIREYVRVVLEQQSAPMPLRAVIETALGNNSGALGYTMENAPRTASEVYARFSSSDIRDTNMEQLATNIEKEVLNVYPDATFELVKLSKHSRKVLRVTTQDKQKVTVAFKGASHGGSGIDFETALFAAIKTLPAVTNTELSSSEKIRLENGFGIDKKLGGKEALDELKARIQDSEFLASNASMAGLLQRAKTSIDSLASQFGDVLDAKLSGGEGGKADIVITIAGPSGPQDIDLSLKYEKGKAGTNLFIFNKDLGDGTQERKLGRDAQNISQFTANLIDSKGTAWWQIARQGIIKELKSKLGADWPLTPGEESDFVSNPGAPVAMKVRRLFIIDKKDRGKASKVPAATLRSAAATFVKSLKDLTPEQVLSIIEESQFGASSSNPLYKLTASSAGAKLKPVGQSSAMEQINAGILKPEQISVEVGNVGNTASVELKLVDNVNKETLASLVVRGLKFRGSVFSSSPGDLKIKTRA